MAKGTPDFSLQVDGVKGICPVGETWAEENILNKKIPIFSCEGPCIRGDIARLAANMVASEEPFARACYAETALVPHSAMARWVKGAAQVIVIDGCFLGCFGRILNNLVDREKITHVDALRFYNKYTDVFYMEDVPELERRDVAKQVAEKILAELQGTAGLGVDAVPASCCGDGTKES